LADNALNTCHESVSGDASVQNAEVNEVTSKGSGAVPASAVQSKASKKMSKKAAKSKEKDAVYEAGARLILGEHYGII
jgi:Tfp pilus assembly protein PilN